MNARRCLYPAIGLFCCGLFINGQTVLYSPATLQLSSTSMQSSVVPAHSSSTLLPFTVEGDTTGTNSFDAVTTDPGVVVSLILPSAVE